MVDSYCTNADVKERLLIDSTDSSYDARLSAAVIEASRTVDIFLKPYTTVPLSSVPTQVAIIAADFAATIFKRRLTPSEVKIRGTLQPDMINDVDGSGWFAIGYKKLQEYIKSYHALAQSPHASGVSYNVDAYMELYKKGVLTLKEARELMQTSTSKIKNVREDVTSAGNTITNTVTDIRDNYHTKRQKKFAFVQGDPDTLTTYKEQDD